MGTQDWDLSDLPDVALPVPDSLPGRTEALFKCGEAAGKLRHDTQRSGWFFSAACALGATNYYGVPYWHELSTGAQDFVLQRLRDNGMDWRAIRALEGKRRA